MNFSEKELIYEINDYLEKLFPLCRSITGENNRFTLKELSKIIELNLIEISSGTKVFDWEIPEEWNINDAYIADINGKKIVNFKESNLHIVSYSIPINKLMYFEELKKNLHLHESLPDAIPYRTSYYKKDWGFCVTKKQYDELSKLSSPLKVFIDSRFSKGSLTYGEYLLKGQSKKELLISCYICHPSMANDSLSGVILTCFLARYLREKKSRKWSYRFVFIPETIGAITYCFFNREIMKKIREGIVITTVGGKGKFSYKKTWDSNHWLNYLIEENFNSLNKEFNTYPFDINGSDERQYSSQGFRINTASIFKDKYYEYKEYHSSLDDLDFVNSNQIHESFKIYKSLIDKIENLKFYKNLKPNCEVMLSKYNLYPTTGGEYTTKNEKYSLTDKVLWILFLCDGNKPIEKIAKDIGIEIQELNTIIEKLIKLGLIKELL